MRHLPWVVYALLLGILVCLLFVSPRFVQAAPLVQPVVDALPAAPVARVSVILELDAPPVAEIYAASLQDARVQSASVDAATAAAQAHLAAVEDAQLATLGALAAYDVEVIYRVQRVYNGIALRVPVDQVDALAALPQVKAVHPLIAKRPNTARAAETVGAPQLWAGNGISLTGEGVSIGIIDTGIDYFHTMFGGPGSGYADDDPNVITDTNVFPSAKVVGGFDFVGDSYDANASASSDRQIPQPDPDPLDCYDFGHGTHVSGIAAGYGVNADGSTYTGPYSATLALDTFRIAPGMAPGASLYALKVFGCSGYSEVVDLAIEWAVDPNQDGDLSDHLDIINLSLGSEFGAVYDATSIAAENAARAGVIVVTSAGNDGDTHYAMASPGVVPGVIAVGASTMPNQYGNANEGIAYFSARGPQRGMGWLKPDLVAPGVNIFSASQGTGSFGVAKMGTSMASPVVAGGMALLREGRSAAGAPGWSPQELKALVMNTAMYPLRDIGGEAFSLLRAGAGRVDLPRAQAGQLIAYDLDHPEAVSVNFGLIEVVDRTTALRTIQLANKSSQAITVTVGYTEVSPMPGVQIDVAAGEVITVPAFGYARVGVTLMAEVASMQRTLDPTRVIGDPFALPQLDVVGGYVTFTPAFSTTAALSTQPPIHVPILAAPRPIAQLEAATAPLDLGDAPSGTIALPLIGQGITSTHPPTTTVSLAGLFELQYSSPPISDVPNGDLALAHYANADLQHVGVMGPVEVAGEQILYFAISTYGKRSTPHEAVFQIQLNPNGNNIPLLTLSNRDRDYALLLGVTISDDFVGVLQGNTLPGRLVQGPINVYSSATYDTRLFESNVIIVPLRIADLASTSHQLQYRIRAFTRDIDNGGTLDALIDQTPWLTADWTAGRGLTQSPVVVPAQPGMTLTVPYDRNALALRHTQGILLLYLHNRADLRAQVLPLEYGWPYSLYLTSIR